MDADLPASAAIYIPVLVAHQKEVWPRMKRPVLLAAQVEQETCPNLKSKSCWNPFAENRRKDEYGFGLGMLTNTKRYNNFETIKAKDAVLSTWTFDDRFNANMQLRALVVWNYASCWRFLHESTATDEDAYAMTFACYNGGLNGVTGAIKRCSVLTGCDPSKYWNNVELTSKKSRTATGRYRISDYQINRDYVFNIMNVRWMKYRSIFTSSGFSAD